jgi:hypothetical protein
LQIKQKNIGKTKQLIRNGGYSDPTTKKTETEGGVDGDGDGVG